MATRAKWSTTCEFTCPKCSSNYYRTEMWSIELKKELDHDEWIGHCKKCPFTWIRSDDWKYFETVKRRRFESKEEFDSRKVK